MPFLLGNRDCTGPLSEHLDDEFPAGIERDFRAGLVPLPAGVYGVRVLPGPHWLWSGWEGQNGRCFGIVRPPRQQELQDWARECAEGGVRPCKKCKKNHRFFHQPWSFHPCRSAVVDWSSVPPSTCFYKAGDEGFYDLFWNPGDLALPRVVGFQQAAIDAIMERFNVAMLASCGDRALCAAIERCEAEFLQDRALDALMGGYSLERVLRALDDFLERDQAVPRNPIFGRLSPLSLDFARLTR